jgi:hypothetical protein
MRKVPAAVFLDRDGVINVNRDDHIRSWDEFVFLPGPLEGIRHVTIILSIAAEAASEQSGPGGNWDAGSVGWLGASPRPSALIRALWRAADSPTAFHPEAVLP